jgi:surface antigen
MKISAAIAHMGVVAALALAYAATEAAADPGKNKHKGGPPGQVGRPGGGPPPWAPAHGYRRMKGHGHTYLFDSVDLFRAPSFDLGGCNKDVIGMLLGAAAGGYAGSHIGDGTGQLAATGAGVLLGGLIGREIGGSMDQLDPACVGHFMESTPPYESVQWQAPRGGTDYRLMPSETYQDENGQYCREYTAEATVDGKPQQTYGTACRQPDGSWRLIN